MLIQIDGAPATAEALQHRVLSNYGHFSSMQVRDGRVRGLRLHLGRLRAATRELFDAALDGDRVRHLIRSALADGDPSATVRVDVFRPPAADVSVMVTVRSPMSTPTAPQRLQTVVFQRPVPHLKHAGTFGQTYHGERAERAGFDEALFVGVDGAIYEGSITNVGFVDGDSVIWPDGPVLRGITWQLLDQMLPERGMPTMRRPVRLAELASFRAVFVTNSLGVVPVGRVDQTGLANDGDAIAAIQRAYDAVPWDEI